MNQRRTVYFWQVISKGTEHEPFSAYHCAAAHSLARLHTLAAGTGSTATLCHTSRINGNLQFSRRVPKIPFIHHHIPVGGAFRKTRDNTAVPHPRYSNQILILPQQRRAIQSSNSPIESEIETPSRRCCCTKSACCQSSAVSAVLLHPRRAHSPPPIPTHSHSRRNDFPCPAPEPEAPASPYAPAPPTAAAAPETQRINAVPRGPAQPQPPRAVGTPRKLQESSREPESRSLPRQLLLLLPISDH